MITDVAFTADAMYTESFESGPARDLGIYDVATRTQLGEPIDLDQPGPLWQVDQPWAAVGPRP